MGHGAGGDVLSVLKAEPLFARWAVAELVSVVGTNVTLVILPVLVYDLTGSAGWAGLLYTARLVPYPVFGQPLGAAIGAAIATASTVTAAYATASVIMSATHSLPG